MMFNLSFTQNAKAWSCGHIHHEWQWLEDSTGYRLVLLSGFCHLWAHCLLTKQGQAGAHSWRLYLIYPGQKKPRYTRERSSIKSVRWWGVLKRFSSPSLYTVYILDEIVCQRWGEIEYDIPIHTERYNRSTEVHKSNGLS